MREIGAFEAKNKLGGLLDCVEKGEEILITRRGKPVAWLVPADAVHNRERRRQAAANILALSEGASLGGLKIKDLINEGRP